MSIAKLNYNLNNYHFLQNISCESQKISQIMCSHKISPLKLSEEILQVSFLKKFLILNYSIIL